jgi:hypothetical protein
MAGEEFVDLGLVRRRLLRRSAHVLVLILSGHPDLPVLTWTVTPDVLRGHADVCDLDPGRDRQVFNDWAEALPASEGCDPMPVLDESGMTRLRANRRVSGVPVVLTAAVHPF